MAVLDLLQLAAGAGAVAVVNHWVPGTGTAGVLAAGAVLLAPVAAVAGTAAAVRLFRTTELPICTDECPAQGRSVSPHDNHD